MADDSAHRWITVEAQCALYADRGKTVVLCDRLPRPVTLVLRVPTDSPILATPNA